MRERTSARYGYGRLITPGEIALITGYEIEAAEKEHTFVREYLQTGSEDLLVEQYCQYANLNYEEIIDFLYEDEPESEVLLAAEISDNPDLFLEEENVPEMDDEMILDQFVKLFKNGKKGPRKKR